MVPKEGLYDTGLFVVEVEVAKPLEYPAEAPPQLH